MKKIKLLLFLVTLFSVINVSALTSKERMQSYKEKLSNYEFNFKYVNQSENIKLIEEKNKGTMLGVKENIQRYFFSGLIRSDIEKIIKLTNEDGIDIDCYRRGQTYTIYENNQIHTDTADKDFCNVVIFDFNGENTGEIKINGSIEEVKGDALVQKRASNIIKNLVGNVYITDIDMVNHYINYKSNSSTFFAGNNAIKEFAKLKKASEENPDLDFFVGYEDTRRGDYFISFAEGVTYISKDGIIYGFSVNTYNCANMFFVPVGTKIEDYKTVLENRIKNYIKDENITIKVSDLEESYNADVANYLPNMLGIKVEDYYKMVNTTFEKELEKANDNDRVYLEQNGQAIMMKAYKLTINDTEYEIGIAELDEKINEFGKILSIDNKTGIIIRTGSSNVPLDASILVDKYELNEKEIEYLTNIGYESINSYNLKLYSKILDKVISEFNNKSEILIPIDNIDTTDLKVIYLSDDGKTHETYDIKKVTYEGKNYISFSTGHFSNYVLVQSTIKNPNTGDNIYYLFILLTISILGTLYIKKKCN